MNTSRIEEIKKSKEKAAQRKYDNFQASGVTKYYTEYQHYSDLVDICNIALSVSEIRDKSIKTNAEMMRLCDNAEHIERFREYYDPETMKAFISDIVLFGRQNDLISDRR